MRHSMFARSGSSARLTRNAAAEYLQTSARTRFGLDLQYTRTPAGAADQSTVCSRPHVCRAARWYSQRQQRPRRLLRRKPPGSLKDIKYLLLGYEVLLTKIPFHNSTIVRVREIPPCGLVVPDHDGLWQPNVRKPGGLSSSPQELKDEDDVISGYSARCQHAGFQT
eukprot:6523-Rhodomonas_salina.1